MKKITFENLDFDENDFDWMEEEPNTNPKVGDTVKVLDNGLLDYINKYDWSGMGRIIGNTYKVKEIGTLYKTDEESVIIYDTGAPPFGRWTVPFKFVKVVSVNESINFDEDDWDYMEDEPISTESFTLLSLWENFGDIYRMIDWLKENIVGKRVDLFENLENDGYKIFKENAYVKDFIPGTEEDIKNIHTLIDQMGIKTISRVFGFIKLVSENEHVLYLSDKIVVKE